MTKINDLNTKDELQDSDKFVIWDGETRAITALDTASYYQDKIAQNFQPADATLTAIAALTNSAGDYIEATGVDTFRARKLTVLTYSALTAIPTQSRHDDMLVYVASRATDGDGGEGWWRFDASSGATANGGTILAPDAGTGRWIRQVEGGEYLVSWFGSSADWGAAFAAAFAAMPAGSTLLLPPQTMSLTDDVIVTLNGLRIKGQHGNNTGVNTGTILSFASGKGIRFGSTSARVINPVLSDVHLTVSSGTGYAVTGYCFRNLILENVSANVMNGVQIGEAATAITGAADNGSGLIRITVGSDPGWQTGLTLYVNNVGGVSAATGAWVITRITGTTYDLQGSTFSGAYTSGGRAAPHCQVFSQRSPRGQAEFLVSASGATGVRINSITGTVLITDTQFVNGDLTGGVPDANTRGIVFPKSASAYDRIDWIRVRNSAFRLFEIGWDIDNTRVVSIEDEGTLYDGSTTGIKYRADSPDDTGGGFENWKIIRPRFELDSDLCTTWIDIDAAAVATGKLLITAAEGVSDGTAIKIDGGSGGLIECQIRGVMVDARPPSGTHYGLQLEGALTQVIVSDIQVRKSSGAGTLANAVRLVTGYTGSPIIRDVQASGHTGLAIEDPDGNAYQEEAPGVFRNAQRQRFILQIRNNAGTLQHAIATSALADTAAYAGLVRKINGASATWTNTPTGTDASTAFAAGGKISSATNFRFIFDTAAQTANRVLAVQVVVLETVGDAVKVYARSASQDVNGVTRNRLVFDFYSAGASWTLNTTNIGSGEAIYLQCDVWLE